jgi:hypothetical protein
VNAEDVTEAGSNARLETFINICADQSFAGEARAKMAKLAGLTQPQIETFKTRKRLVSDWNARAWFARLPAGRRKPTLRLLRAGVEPEPLFRFSALHGLANPAGIVEVLSVDLPSCFRLADLAKFSKLTIDQFTMVRRIIATRPQFLELPPTVFGVPEELLDDDDRDEWKTLVCRYLRKLAKMDDESRTKMLRMLCNEGPWPGLTTPIEPGFQRWELAELCLEPLFADLTGDSLLKLARTTDVGRICARRLLNTPAGVEIGREKIVNIITRLGNDAIVVVLMHHLRGTTLKKWVNEPEIRERFANFVQGMEAEAGVEGEDYPFFDALANCVVPTQKELAEYCSWYGRDPTVFSDLLQTKVKWGVALFLTWLEDFDFVANFPFFSSFIVEFLDTPESLWAWAQVDHDKSYKDLKWRQKAVVAIARMRDSANKNTELATLLRGYPVMLEIIDPLEWRQLLDVTQGGEMLQYIVKRICEAEIETEEKKQVMAMFVASAKQDSMLDLGVAWATHTLKRYPTARGFARRLKSDGKTKREFERTPFAKQGGGSILRFFEKHFWAMGILVLPVAWYLGSIPGIVEYQITGGLRYLGRPKMA